MRATSSSRGTDRISSNHPSERPRLMPNSAETATSARSWGRSTPCAVILAAKGAARRGSSAGRSSPKHSVTALPASQGLPGRVRRCALPVQGYPIPLEDPSWSRRAGWPCLDHVMLHRHSPRVHRRASGDFRVSSPRTDPDGEIVAAAASGQVREMILQGRIPVAYANVGPRPDCGLLDGFPRGKIGRRFRVKHAHVERNVSPSVTRPDFQGRTRARDYQAVRDSVRYIPALDAEDVIVVDVVIERCHVVRMVINLQLVVRERAQVKVVSSD